VTADDPDPLPNSVTATASGGISDKEVSDGDDCESDITHEPGISVTKDCPATALVGEEVTYTITITNTGDEELTGITVEDSLLGDISNLFPTTLDVGDSGTEEVTRVVQPGEDPVENTVTVSATGADSEETATDTASCSSNVLGPDIQIVKDGPALAHVGDTVTYSFTVTNTGEVPLFDVTITDDRCDPGTLSDFTGDTNDNGILGLEEVWHATCTHVVEKSDEDPVPNTAVVDATDREGNPTSDDDSHLVDIIHPAIEVVKSVTPQDGQPGDDVTYSYEVTNTGDTTLFDVSVDDDKLGHIGDIASLEPGESVTLTKATTLPNVAGDLTNVVVADGADELGKHVSDDDSVTVTVVLPSPPILPKTGADVGTVGQTGVLLILLGFVMVRGSRRPHPVGPASLGWQAAQVRRASLLVSWQARARGRAPSPRARGRARGRDPDAGPPHTTGP
jgi:uncharacterized repeat protein (TIGR01451 family)